jgi:hypothetical protein
MLWHLHCSGRAVVQPLGQPVDVHLQRHQQRAQLVVDLAGDAGALLLAHRLAVVGQLAQALGAGLQLGGALGHAAFQPLVGAAQQGLGLAPGADVDQGDHRALHQAMLDDRVAGVLGVEGGAVGTPEHLVVDAAGPALAEGLEDRAVGLRVVPAVGMGVVDQLVHVAADDRIGRPAQHLRRAAVDEDAAAGHVEAEDALAGRFEQQAQPVAPDVGDLAGAAGAGVGGWQVGRHRGGHAPELQAPCRAAGHARRGVAHQPGDLHRRRAAIAPAPVLVRRRC